MWRLCRTRTVILLYHRIARLGLDPWSISVTPEHFAEHLQVLRKFKRERLDQLEPRAGPLRGLSVAITFDDGYADNLYEAAPLLERFDMPATFFIATGYIGDAGEFWWDELERLVFCADGIQGPRDPIYRQLYAELQPLPHEARRRRLDALAVNAGACKSARPTHRILAEDELWQLDAHPLFEIGAHTVTHPVLAALSPANQSAEVSDSKNYLEALLGHPVTSFSYPYGGSGHYSALTVQAVRQAGFERACTTAGYPLQKPTPRHEWGRLNVTDMDGDQFEKFLWS
jgi:peptidoglycan/xylan/chitin deacetylase (PgdA/CDA1 family)